MLSTISSFDKQITIKNYRCSNGRVFRRSADATACEMLLHLEDIFPGVALRSGHNNNRRRFYFSKKYSLECGIYHIIIKNDDQFETLEYFFNGIDEKLDYPDEYPFEVDLEIYYENIPNAIYKHAQWKLYDEKEHRY